MNDLGVFIRFAKDDTVTCRDFTEFCEALRNALKGFSFVGDIEVHLGDKRHSDIPRRAYIKPEVLE